MKLDLKGLNDKLRPRFTRTGERVGSNVPA